MVVQALKKHTDCELQLHEKWSSPRKPDSSLINDE